MADEQKLHARVTPGLSGLERLALVCACLGAAALVFAAWLIWVPLALASLGIVLLAVARYAAKASGLVGSSESSATPRKVPPAPIRRAV
jgi:hypothetical protein